jgi:protein-S-isoprenylcysteine O-methyltransferase Ste14
VAKKNDSEDRSVAGTRIPPPLTLTAVILAGFALEHFYPLHLPIRSSASAIAGTLLLGAGLVLGALAVRALIRGGSHPYPHRPAGAIVTSGIYAKTRNPIYFSMAVLLLGVGMLARNGWHLIGFAVFVVLIDRTQIPREEQYLEECFGAEYQAYKRRVRRWV